MSCFAPTSCSMMLPGCFTAAVVFHTTCPVPYHSTINLSTGTKEPLTLKNGHVKALTEIREKIRETLISVNEYIYYKQSKQKGEEWRDIKEPHQ